MDAMLDMMQRMMGQNPDGDQKSQSGKGQGQTGGEGQTGDSSSQNNVSPETGGGEKSERTVPKTSGSTGQNLPSEFQKALDAYNK